MFYDPQRRLPTSESVGILQGGGVLKDDRRCRCRTIPTSSLTNVGSKYFIRNLAWVVYFRKGVGEITSCWIVMGRVTGGVETL